MKEIWKVIEGYGGRYQVSDRGRVRSQCRKKLKVLKDADDGTGYRHVVLMDNGKMRTRKVHRLVALSFLYKTENRHLIVNHKDLNRANNRLANLELVTPKENSRHAYERGCYQRKLTLSQVRTIIRRITTGEEPKRLSEEFRVGKSMISRIKHGVRHSHLHAI